MMNKERQRWLEEGEQAGSRYELSMPRRMMVGTAGSALGQNVGSSLELKDYREYQPGDDLRHVDWNAYARSDQVSIKLFREEVHPRLDMVLDVTRSMALEKSAKERATLALASFFATVAGNSGFTRRAWMLGDQLTPLVNATELPSHWEVPELEIPSANPNEALAGGGGLWRAQGVRILLSDLLWEGDPLVTMRHLTDRAAQVIVVQVLAKSDAEPPQPGSYRLVDVETNQEREIYVDASVAQRYRESFNRHLENWHHACRQSGAIFTTVIAEQLLQHWQLDELMAAEILRIK